jgi:hypothetical protein
MGYSGAGGKLIHKKNQKQKISWHCPFKFTNDMSDSSDMPHDNCILSIDVRWINSYMQWHPLQLITLYKNHVIITRHFPIRELVCTMYCTAVMLSVRAHQVSTYYIVYCSINAYHIRVHSVSHALQRREIIYWKRAILSLSSSKILTPHPLLRPASVYPPAFVGGEDTLARRRGGRGINILEDERDRIALFQ